MTGIANIALLSEETGRIFGLDAQLLFDILIQGLAVFLLFIFLTYVLINPVRKVLEDRQNKIKDDLSHAATDRAELGKLLRLSDTQMGYVTNVEAGHGLLRMGGALVPFVNTIPKDTELYRLMTTTLSEISDNFVY